MSRLIVPDCSVSAAWCLPDESTPDARRMLSDVRAGSTALLVPALWWYEMLNVLRSAVKRNRLSFEDANEAVRYLGAVPLKVVALGPTGESGVLRRAVEDDLTAYDAAYVHVAMSAGAELVTRDSALLALRPKFPFIKRPDEY